MGRLLQSSGSYLAEARVFGDWLRDVADGGVV